MGHFAVLVNKAHCDFRACGCLENPRISSSGLFAGLLDNTVPLKGQKRYPFQPGKNASFRLSSK